MTRIIIGIFLFCLLHFENISVGPIKISILWKLLLISLLISKVIKIKNKNRFYLPFLYISILSLIHLIFDSTAFSISATFLLFYLLGVYLSSLSHKKQIDILDSFLFLFLFHMLFWV